MSHKWRLRMPLSTKNISLVENTSRRAYIRLVESYSYSRTPQQNYHIITQVGYLKLFNLFDKTTQRSSASIYILLARRTSEKARKKKNPLTSSVLFVKKMTEKAGENLENLKRKKWLIFKWTNKKSLKQFYFWKNYFVLSVLCCFLSQKHDTCSCKSSSSALFYVWIAILSIGVIQYYVCHWIINPPY